MILSDSLFIVSLLRTYLSCRAGDKVLKTPSEREIRLIRWPDGKSLGKNLRFSHQANFPCVDRQSDRPFFVCGFDKKTQEPMRSHGRAAAAQSYLLTFLLSPLFFFSRRACCLLRRSCCGRRRRTSRQNKKTGKGGMP